MAKRYVKPDIQSDYTFDIGEKVYLINSGWNRSDCYIASDDITQTIGTGYVKLNYHIDAYHGKYPWDPNDSENCKADHYNESQYLILEFAGDITPYLTSISKDGSPVSYEVNTATGNTKARILCNYHNNEWDVIGSGNYELNFVPTAGLTATDLNSLIDVVDIYLSDAGMRLYHNYG